jgi:hypothetical protein
MLKEYRFCRTEPRWRGRVKHSINEFEMWKYLLRGWWRVASSGSSSFRNPLFHAFFVLTVPQMNLEVVHRRGWTGGIKFPWAIVAPDTGEI